MHQEQPRGDEGQPATQHDPGRGPLRDSPGGERDDEDERGQGQQAQAVAER